jgi:broad specificity phosphatase PhoE
MRIHLIRHAEVENPEHVVYADLPGFALSMLGRDQGTAAGRYLQNWPLTQIVTSPLERGMETAGLLSDATDAPVAVDGQLTEWLLATRWAGVHWEELGQRFPGELEAYLAHPEALPFSPEPLPALAERVAGAILSWVDGAVGDVAFVSHQDPIHAGRLMLTGAGFSSFHEDKPEHCSVSTLEPSGDAWAMTDYWAPRQ